jgi:hypothetical protein
VTGTATPFGDQIERFLSSIVENVKPRSAHQVPSHRWLQQGLGHLVNSLVFYFKDFTLTKHERVRIATTVNQLFEEGKLTEDPAIERHHIGVFWCSQARHLSPLGCPYKWDYRLGRHSGKDTVHCAHGCPCFTYRRYHNCATRCS